MLDELMTKAVEAMRRGGEGKTEQEKAWWRQAERDWLSACEYAEAHGQRATTAAQKLGLMDEQGNFIFQD